MELANLAHPFLRKGFSPLSVVSFPKLLEVESVGLVSDGFTRGRPKVWTKKLDSDVWWRFTLRQDRDQEPYTGVLVAGVLVPGVAPLLKGEYGDDRHEGMLYVELTETKPWRQGLGPFDISRAGRSRWGRGPSDPQVAAEELLRGVVAEGKSWMSRFATVHDVAESLRTACERQDGPPGYFAFPYLAGVLWRAGRIEEAEAVLQRGLRARYAGPDVARKQAAFRSKLQETFGGN